MNCLALEQEEGIVVVDCGVTFPHTDLGIDVYHPRFDYLLAREGRLMGVVITHGHEDHIGALPYLLGAADVPVYGPPHALELCRARLAEHGFEEADLDLVTVKPGAPFEVGPFAIEPIRVTHSITDATALAIRTAAGLVIHTGDFKLDPLPPDGELTDEMRLLELGEEGVRLLLSDSTNVDSPGTSASESEVGDALFEIVAAAKTRVILGVFASNVQRLRVIGEIAQRTRRRICLLGRSVVNHVRAAETVGKIRWPSDLLVPPDQAASIPRDKLLVIASGTQAERGSALTRLANGTHQHLRIDPGDVVILSSRIIPGNDRVVYDLMGDLLRAGVELVSRITDRRIHASGHAHRDEQRRMIELTRPRAFVPVHGTLHHLFRHAELARGTGVGEVLIAENGDVIEIGESTPPTKAGRAPVGKVATFNGDELSDEVLRERAQLGRGGVACVSLVLDRRGALVTAPEIQSRGVLEPQVTGIARKVQLAVTQAIGNTSTQTRNDDDAVADVARLAARRAIEAHTGRRPMVIVTVSRP
ncbi:Ribonuclease J2 (endoribonuclease in RNA processing) [Minicystis rosea]|nr:Ribonuclease J2 (endoribonuclease in RNA processing) [Minicystis rosea]